MISEPAIHAVHRRTWKWWSYKASDLSQHWRSVRGLQPIWDLQMSFKFISRFVSPANKKKSKFQDCRRRLSVLELMLLIQLKTTAFKINITHLVSEAAQLKYFHADVLLNYTWSEMAEKNWSSSVRDFRQRSKNTMDIKVVDNLVHHKLCSHSYKWIQE